MMVRMQQTIPKDIYYTLKELSALKGHTNVAPLALEIFKDYIRQHEKDLLHLED